MKEDDKFCTIHLFHLLLVVEIQRQNTNTSIVWFFILPPGGHVLPGSRPRHAVPLLFPFLATANEEVMTVEKRGRSKGQGREGPSKFVARAPALRAPTDATLGGPEFHMSLRAPGLQRGGKEERGGSSISAQSVKSTHFIILIVGCGIAPSTDCLPCSPVVAQNARSVRHSA